MRLVHRIAQRLALAATILAGVSSAAVAQQQASSSDAPPPVPASATSTTSTTSRATGTPTPSPPSIKPAPVVADDAALRIEGEKRFRANCGRCHMAPHKFPPRTMATAVRHMRVRAMITDEDMRLILRYLTQ